MCVTPFSASIIIFRLSPYNPVMGRGQRRETINKYTATPPLDIARQKYAGCSVLILPQREQKTETAVEATLTVHLPHLYVQPWMEGQKLQ